MPFPCQVEQTVLRFRRESRSLFKLLIKLVLALDEGISTILNVTEIQIHIQQALEFLSLGKSLTIRLFIRC